MQGFTMQSSRGVAALLLMAALVVTAVVFMVVDNIEHYRSTEIIDQGFQDVLGYTLLAVGLG